MPKKGALSEIHKQLVTHFDSTEGLSIVDYGCGTGGLTRVLLDNFKHPDLIVAVDSDPKMIEKVVSSFSSEISYVSIGQFGSCQFDVMRYILRFYDSYLYHKVSYSAHLYNSLLP